jgi:hypothetical protein
VRFRGVRPKANGVIVTGNARRFNPEETFLEKVFWPLGARVSPRVDGC